MNQYQSQFPNQPMGGFPAPQKTNGLAIAGFVCSFFCGILGIIFGAVALSQINKTNGGGKGLAIAGICIGAASTVVGWLIIAAMTTASSGGY